MDSINSGGTPFSKAAFLASSTLAGLRPATNSGIDDLTAINRIQTEAAKLFNDLVSRDKFAPAGFGIGMEFTTELNQLVFSKQLYSHCYCSNNPIIIADL